MSIRLKPPLHKKNDIVTLMSIPPAHTVILTTLPSSFPHTHLTLAPLQTQGETQEPHLAQVPPPAPELRIVYSILMLYKH